MTFVSSNNAPSAAECCIICTIQPVRWRGSVKLHYSSYHYDRMEVYIQLIALPTCFRIISSILMRSFTVTNVLTPPKPIYHHPPVAAFLVGCVVNCGTSPPPSSISPWETLLWGARGGGGCFGLFHQEIIRAHQLCFLKGGSPNNIFFFFGCYYHCCLYMRIPTLHVKSCCLSLRRMWFQCVFTGCGYGGSILGLNDK